MILPTKKVALCGFVTVTSASVLRLPITAQHNVDNSMFASGQVPLGRPVKSFQNLFYKTNITIGTPPQTFNVALDTMVDELFVPSICPEPCYYHLSRTYNHSESSTYMEHGGSGDVSWAGMDFRGPLSYDTIHLGDSSISEFLFEEWNDASCRYIGCMGSGYDGVLGLAPPWGVESRHRPNILSALLLQNVLDEPLFSLKLPTGLDEEGELLFGAINSKLNSSALIDLPVVNVTHPDVFSRRWTVEASHVKFDSPRPLEITLPTGGFAVLDSGDPYIILPEAMARNLTAAIGAKPGPAWFHHIPCERRQLLPLLTFTLDGHNFSISAFEYTLEIDPPGVYPPGALHTCITTFMSQTDFLYPRDWNGIALGSPFLRGFYSVWDFERQKVRLANLK